MSKDVVVSLAEFSEHNLAQSCFPASERAGQPHRTLFQRLVDLVDQFRIVEHVQFLRHPIFLGRLLKNSGAIWYVRAPRSEERPDLL
jgi:hypothetical protein